MKNTLLLTLISLASVSLLQAATTINATNAVPGGTGFVTQVRFNGAPYTGATIMSGTFTSTPLGSGEITLASFGWTMFASQAFSNNAIAPGVFGALMAPGQTAGMTGLLPTTATGPFIGNNIFLVVANPTNNEFIIWDTGIDFAVEDALLGGAAVAAQTRNATLVRGALVPRGNSGLGGPIAAFNGGTAVTFIPEPSAVLLSALGALALLRRRRN